MTFIHLLQSFWAEEGNNHLPECMVHVSSFLRSQAGGDYFSFLCFPWLPGSEVWRQCWTRTWTSHADLNQLSWVRFTIHTGEPCLLEISPTALGGHSKRNYNSLFNCNSVNIYYEIMCQTLWLVSFYSTSSLIFSVEVVVIQSLINYYLQRLPWQRLMTVSGLVGPIHLGFSE